jgi:hypothetical protein
MPNAQRQARLSAVACMPMFGMGVVSKHTELGRKLLVFVFDPTALGRRGTLYLVL